MSTSEPSSKRPRTDDVLDENSEGSLRTRGDILKEANDALQESNKIHVRPIVDEKNLGIELFVGDRKDEFHGLIKTRYADFIVHEVDLDGNVSYLTNLEAPDDTAAPKTVELSDFLDSVSLECMAEVNNGYLNRHMIDVTGMDKNARTSLHHAIKATFDRLESSTLTESELAKQDKKEQGSTDKESNKNSDNQQVQSDDAKASESSIGTNDASAEEKRFIVVTRRNKISRPKSVWPRDRPDHTHFILYKENKDTMDAVHNLAAAINTRPSNFSFAGTKDRRAVTTQWLSSWRLEPRRLIAACRRFNKRPFIKVGNFCFKKDPIRLGQLKSNKFDIVIRHLVYNHEGAQVVEKAMESIKQNGFVNYFGLQRFGTRTIQTHEVGLAILREKWDKAVDLILSYRFDDNMHPPLSQDEANKELTNVAGDVNQTPPSNQAMLRNDRHKQEGKRWSNGAEQHNSFIDMWKTKLDAEIVFKKYPHYRFSNEGLIMKSLSKSDDANKNHLNALTSLPRTTRSMYVHSYQSLIWNKIVTFRLREFGFEVAPGDLILTSDSNISDNSLEVLLTTDEAELIDDPSVKNNNETPAKQDVTKKTNIEDIESKIVFATEENCKDYTIFDVVLPIVGSRVRLPTNSVGDEINRLLQDDGLSLESFKTHEKLFISYGSYRKIMVKPNNVSWSLRQYSNPHQNLVETDLDRLNRETATKGKTSEEKPNSPPKSDSNDEALVVELELPPSSYATMCLREIMKKPSTDFNSRF